MQPQYGPHVVAISGSLNDDSITRQALDRALDEASAEGARTTLVDLREYDLPMVDPNGDPPADAERVTEHLASADGMLLGTPMYNGSFSSPLKTAIDHSDVAHFEGLPVGLVGVAGGQFPLRALDHLRAVASHMGADVLPEEVAIPNSHAVGDELPDDVAERLDDLAESLVDRSRRTVGCMQATASATD